MIDYEIAANIIELIGLLIEFVNLKLKKWLERLKIFSTVLMWLVIFKKNNIDVINILAIFSHGKSFEKAPWQRGDSNLRHKFGSPLCQGVYSNDIPWLNISNILITSNELWCRVVGYLWQSLMSKSTNEISD